ncbi:histidine kinase [Oceanobacillus sp. 143]|uniref:Histidine kinase n=1 Tax=Oceanobacillus zhaokaii TaxID=2052660 RepID=A0A345PEX6_9BACI|nr:2TM domain-containing protein [Oceanobacillus zhaokaii]AXI08556.1 histidine kinase [Oceanobacillus zhaokaii]QGS68371.1 histidine kinase [Oceanobacillus sp. 143]
MENEEKYLRAKKRVQNLKEFYQHLLSYVLVNTMLFIINMVTDPSYWWFIFPLMGWGIGLIAHAFSVYSDGFMGADWEERKIKEYMEKDRRDE